MSNQRVIEKEGTIREKDNLIFDLEAELEITKQELQLQEQSYFELYQQLQYNQIQLAEAQGQLENVVPGIFGCYL